MTLHQKIIIDEIEALQTILSKKQPVQAVLWRGQPGFAKLKVPLRLHERALIALTPLLRRWVAKDLQFTPRTYASDTPVEVQRLRDMKAAGWNVPDVLVANENIFITADVGKTLVSLLPGEDDPKVRRSWLLESATDLARFHAAGQWHGAAQIRNIVLTHDGHWGRIDFEPGLDMHLPLPILQAFDTALFLTSIVRMRDRDILPEIAQAYFDSAPESAIDALRRGMPLVQGLARSRLIKFLAPKESKRLHALSRVAEIWDSSPAR